MEEAEEGPNTEVACGHQKQTPPQLLTPPLQGADGRARLNPLPPECVLLQVRGQRFRYLKAAQTDSRHPDGHVRVQVGRDEPSGGKNSEVVFEQLTVPDESKLRNLLEDY